MAIHPEADFEASAVLTRPSFRPRTQGCRHFRNQATRNIIASRKERTTGCHLAHDGWGSNVSNSRLFQTFFFNIEGAGALPRWGAPQPYGALPDRGA
jgi:hypothetical protein